MSVPAQAGTQVFFGQARKAKATWIAFGRDRK